MAHAHPLVDPGSDQPLTPDRTRRALNGVVIACLVATAIALAVLWPRGDEGPDLAAELGFVELVDATRAERAGQPVLVLLRGGPLRVRPRVGSPDQRVAGR